MGEPVGRGSSYRHCPDCGVDVPVERKFPRTTLILSVLMVLSLLVTAILYPRILFLFILLPVGLGMWRKAEHCAMCGRRLPRVNPP